MRCNQFSENNLGDTFNHKYILGYRLGGGGGGKTKYNGCWVLDG